MTLQRDAQLDRLDDSVLDLLVVGGGIVGSRIAWDAARSGMRVALVDRGDFACGTSSSSSKLVHGGLRYLSTFDLPLVRQLQGERKALMSALAPHLVRPLPMLLVVERAHRRRAAKLAAGLGIYSAIARCERPRPRLVQRSDAAALVPDLDTSNVFAAGLLTEGQTHDARLVLTLVRAAAAAGALTLNYVELGAIGRGLRHGLRGAVLRELVGNRQLFVRTKAIVNATGPWIDRVRALEDSRLRPIARFSKGVHVVLPLERQWTGGVALFDESRTAFAVPWQGMLLVGTTDTEYDDDAADACVSPRDVAAVLAPLAGVLPAGMLDPQRAVHSFAGIRVLDRGERPTSRASRGHLIEVSPNGMISVAGGKLTSHRLIALDALEHLPPELRPHQLTMTHKLLSSTNGEGVTARLRRYVSPDVATHLAGLYGAEAIDLLSYEQARPDALEPIHAAGPDIWAQVYRAQADEWAVNVTDVVARRTTLAVRGLATDRVRQRIATVLEDSAVGVPS